jgi:hypothetical protein
LAGKLLQLWQNLFGLHHGDLLKKNPWHAVVTIGCHANPKEKWGQSIPEPRSAEAVSTGASVDLMKHIDHYGQIFYVKE